MAGKDKIIGKDGIYFTPEKNSELCELQVELESMKVDRQKDALKQIIASMTLGKDVSPLFPQVVNCMRTSDIELKKLIYLYIINYSKAKPLESILAVNAFVTDASDKKSPMIRALAVRTMGCIRVDEIVTYLCDALKNSLADEDAYVRKTGCICVAKLFTTCPSLVKDGGFIELLTGMLSDGNSIVVSNALIALTEISTLSGEKFVKFKSTVLKRILNALNEANEWGQLSILDALINFNKKKAKYAEMIIDAVIPRLTHLNSAVILSALKVILKYMDVIDNEDKLKAYSKKISTSLVTLMDSFPEMQYLLLRAMHAIIQKRHYLLDKDFRSFFVKYTDPVYVKLEKLEILYKLADNKNYEMILNELRTYAMLEFNIVLVQTAIRYLGGIGYKFEKSLDQCVDCLSQILDYNKDFTINPGVIVMRDILRKYSKNPKPKELLKKINEKMIESITFPESKAAILYILGEHAGIIDQSTELISLLLNDFASENEKVKLQILNACIKNFVTKIDDTKAEDLVKIVLQKGAEETQNPDVRDRAYFYWRLLEVDPESAKEMIMGEKPSFSLTSEDPIESTLCDDIIENITNISCIYHKKASEMLLKEDMLIEEEDPKDSKDIPNSTTGNIGNAMTTAPKKKIIQDKMNINDADLLGLGDLFSGQASIGGNNNSQLASQTSISSDGHVIMETLGSNSGVQSFPQSENVNDIEFLDDIGSASSSSIVIFNESTGVTLPKPFLCFKSTDKALGGTCGVAIYGLFHRENSKLMLGLHIQNNIKAALKGFSVKTSPNSFGIRVHPSLNPQVFDYTVNSEVSKNMILNLEVSQEQNNKTPPTCPYSIEVSVSTNIDEFQFSVPFYLNILFSESGKLSSQLFTQFYKQNNATKQTYLYEDNVKVSNEDGLNKLFERNNIFVVARNTKEDPPIYYYSCSISDTIPVVIEVSFKSKRSIGIGVMTAISPIHGLMKQVLDFLLIGNS